MSPLPMSPCGATGESRGETRRSRTKPSRGRHRPTAMVTAEQGASGGDIFIPLMELYFLWRASGEVSIGAGERQRVRERRSERKGDGKSAKQMEQDSQ